MPNYNHTVQMGHLTKDPELSYTNNGNAVTNFTVAVNRQFGKDATDFFSVTAWNRGNYKLAEYVAEYKKGDLVLVVGELRQDRWEQEGQSRSRIKINADKVVNLTKRNKPADEPSEDSQGKGGIDEELDTPF